MLQQQQEQETTQKGETPRYVIASGVQQAMPEEPRTSDTADAVALSATTTPAVSQVSVPTANVAVETAQSWLDYVAIQRVQRWDATSAAIVAIVSITTLMPLFQLYTILDHNEFAPSIYPVLIWSLLSPVVPLSLMAMINSQRRQNVPKNAENNLPETPTVAWIGPLVDALESHSRPVRETARRLLPQLLLQIRPRHGELLTSEQWEILGQRLRNNADRDMELNLATLKMLAHIGGEGMLAFVEGAASSSVWSRGALRVRRAARECLPVLDARLQAEAATTSNIAPRAAITIQQVIEEQRTVNPELAKLLAELEEQRKGQAQPGMRIGFMLAAYMTILPAAAWKTAESLLQADWFGGALWGTTVLVTTQLHRLSLFPSHRDLMRKLADYDDVAGVGALAETLEWPDRRVQDMAARALVRLLPRLRASDARLLSPTQRGCLYRVLSMRHVGRDSTLVLAILQALQQVGDEAAIPYVQRLARSTTFGPTQRKVRQAAEECLPYLRNSADMQRASQTLLRASAQENVASDALLRPAYTNTTTEPAEMVRALSGLEGAAPAD
jgi:HEAT repeat protein